MAFDGIITKCIIYELNNCILQGKINKVYEPNKNEIILGIYSNGKNYALNICINPINYRIHLTTFSKPNPLNAPNFCMLLRKHLIGMRISSISNYDLERIISIKLEGYNELNDFVEKTLIIELMGKHSNIILINHNNRIIDSLRHLDLNSNSNRNILPSHEYVYPPSNKISFLNLNSFKEFYEIIHKKLKDFDIDFVLSDTFTGISKIFVHSLLDSLNLNKTKISKEDLEILYNYLKNLLENLGTSSLSCENYIDSQKNKLDYTITLKQSSSTLSVNFFLDDFYSKKEASEAFIGYRNNILKLILSELNKYKKRLYNIDKKLEECNKKDIYKLYGELITANLYRISNKNLNEIELENYYDNNTLLKIPLDKSISPSSNAKKYFKKYNKLKNASEIINMQKVSTSKDIDYIESIIYSIENAITINELNLIYEEISENILSKEKTNYKKNLKISKKKISQQIAPLKFLIDGYTVYVGKNNTQNEYLTLKFAKGNDLWFHTKEIHGSHVILKSPNAEIENETLNKCASLAAYYSKALHSSNVPVDYTYIRYVKKASGSKPGMVIYTNYTTINVNPKNFSEQQILESS
ncbi:MAG: fibronectin/fibrinogen-binding protein [Clostridia bacterium]|nr:fibronectin/fibrinogen-binding protein [Clostridia bacterium]